MSHQPGIMAEYWTGKWPQKIYYKKIMPVEKLLSEKVETKNNSGLLSTRGAKV